MTKTLTISIWETVLRPFWHFYLLLVRHDRFICFIERFVLALHLSVFVSVQVLRKYKVTKLLTISIWETVLRHFCFWHFYLLLVRHDRFICFIARFVIALHLFVFFLWFFVRTYNFLVCFIFIHCSSVAFFVFPYYARTKPLTISVCTENLLVCCIIVAMALRHANRDIYSVFKCVFFLRTYKLLVCFIFVYRSSVVFFDFFSEWL